MPNWSSCTIEFSGDKKKIERLYRNIKEHGYNFSYFKEPNFKKDTSWYRWRLKNWGTKWNISEDKKMLISEDSTCMSIEFDAPWNGPITWFTNVCFKYNINGTYRDIENGNDFFQLVEIEDGEITFDVVDNYFSNESISSYGIDYFINEFSCIGEDILNQPDENRFVLDMFKKNGYGIKELKEEWGS